VNDKICHRGPVRSEKDAFVTKNFSVLESFSWINKHFSICDGYHGRLDTLKASITRREDFLGDFDKNCLTRRGEGVHRGGGGRLKRNPFFPVNRILIWKAMIVLKK
jgi:hypothetical protein